MGCLIAVLAVLLPRVLMVFIAILTDWFPLAFRTTIWPLLGWVFMPYTTLAYMGAMLRNGEVSGWWLVLVIFAVLVDIGVIGGSSRKART
ncbi:MAG TPA: hypothetical protein VM141_03840 [Planctomycetota bacterium]|nr:hypothetical protein [Planctomycetota bacterium]